LTEREKTGSGVADATVLTQGRCGSPFDILGIHPSASTEEPGRIVRAFIPWARGIAVERQRERVPMERAGDGGLFQAEFPEATDFFAYQLVVDDPSGQEWTIEDPYRFGPALDEGRVRAFLEGRERRAHDFLGARPVVHEGVDGTLFSVWAPHALAVNLMGDMNGWDARCHPMRSRGATGVWELFVPGVGVGIRYKYQVVTGHGERLEKADPFGRAVELRPATASEVWDGSRYRWKDDEWMAERAARQADGAAVSVYEVHLGSWRRNPTDDGTAWSPGWLGYRALADELLPYVEEMGFTHVELLPVMEPELGVPAARVLRSDVAVRLAGRSPVLR